MRDDIIEAPLAEIRQVHEYRYARSKFDQFLLNLLPQALVLLLLLGQFPFLLRGHCLVRGLLSRLLDRLRFVDDCLDVLIQVAKSLDARQRSHCLGIPHQSPQRCIVDIDQQGALPATGQQSRRRSAHGNVENPGGIDLLHRTAVVGQHRKERDKLLDLAFGIILLDIQPAAVIRNVPQCPVGSKVEYVTLLFQNIHPVGRNAVGIAYRPGRLHAKGRLEVGFGA